MSPSEQFVRLSCGERVRVRTWGEGDHALFLLHGFMGSVDAWGGLAPALATGLRVVAVDLPGHGASDGGTNPDRYAIPRIADEMIELHRVVCGGPAWWLGYSMGGRIALAAAVRGAGMRGLLLESASPGIAEPGARAERRRLDEARAAHLEDGGIESFVDAWLAMPLFAGVAVLDRPAWETARAVRASQDPRRMAAWLRGGGAGNQPPYWDALPGIPCPVRLLTGARDTKFTALARRMADGLADATVTVIPGVGHLPHIEAPTRWVDWVRESLGPGRPSTAAEGVDPREGH